MAMNLPWGLSVEYGLYGFVSSMTFVSAMAFRFVATERYTRFVSINGQTHAVRLITWALVVSCHY